MAECEEVERAAKKKRFEARASFISNSSEKTLQDTQTKIPTPEMENPPQPVRRHHHRQIPEVPRPTAPTVRTVSTSLSAFKFYARIVPPHSDRLPLPKAKMHCLHQTRPLPGEMPRHCRSQISRRGILVDETRLIEGNRPAFYSTEPYYHR